MKRADGVLPSALLQEGLAELAPAGAKKIQNIFAGGMYVGKNQPSTGRKTCGSAGRKCPHTASKPLRIHKVFSAAFSLSASISAPAELLRIGQPWIFEGFLFFWTQAGCRPPRTKGQKAPKRLAVRRMGFLPVDGKLGSLTCEPSECAAASRIFSKRSLAKQGSFLMYQHHSRLWGLFFTGGV